MAGRKGIELPKHPLEVGIALTPLAINLHPGQLSKRRLGREVPMLEILATVGVAAVMLHVLSLASEYLRHWVEKRG